jgi:NADPH2:quinone reductase
MRAVEVTRFGGPEVLAITEAPEPVAGAGQMVVAVTFVDTLFLDTQLRSGAGQDFFPLHPPYVPGDGVAGTVARVGSGVGSEWVGRAVVALTSGVGAYAEQVAVEADQVVAMPDSLELRDAAALVHDGRTAYALVESIGVQSGERVLILAAAGGLGLLLVQLAHAAGAYVIGAARGKQKLAAVTGHGADQVVDYTDPAWTERVTELTSGRGPDVVFDGAGGMVGQQAAQIIALGGRFSAHGAAGGGFTIVDPDQVRLRQIIVKGIEQAQLDAAYGRRVTARALAEAAAGRIRPLVGLTLPLERAAEAHAAIESRTVVGKTLLVV